ncbi:hypothetical protein C8J57DRAFT_1228327 [Mycena rebaudengoi]|nr:hypothetical protein C8J57DRAFT_1228327 [Mycena rebaudengoi]
MNLFSNHPQRLEVLRMKLISPLFRSNRDDLPVFRPLCVVNGLLVNRSFLHEDSPLDFLSDFRRAGLLYKDSYRTAEKAVIRWICFLKKVMDGTDVWRPFEMIRSSQVLVLHEIGTLNLSQLCDLLKDPLIYGFLIGHLNTQNTLDPVIDWLRRYPDPPTGLIEI